ncbi:hypothetical protein HZ326_9577 [Fusarium oxysporum f. sp. albedinis]|nr:hypothetical protein HZ326_9577 [Fusarium oxysporum f. sp. albedinis]
MVAIQPGFLIQLFSHNSYLQHLDAVYLNVSVVCGAYSTLLQPLPIQFIGCAHFFRSISYGLMQSSVVGWFERHSGVKAGDKVRTATMTDRRSSRPPKSK